LKMFYIVPWIMKVKRGKFTAAFLVLLFTKLMQAHIDNGTF
jgi:hypothetical protein